MAMSQMDSAPGRPRDRRAQLIREAVRLFWERGYDGVSVADVAAAAGITAAAVYRHLPNKESMLVEPIREMVTAWYGAALVAQDGAANPVDALDRLVTAVVEVAMDRPDVVGLWHRESRNLQREARDELVVLRATTVAHWSATLLACDPGLTVAQAEFRIRAALGLLNSVAVRRAPVARIQLSAHLQQMMKAVLLSATVPDPRERAVPAFDVRHHAEPVELARRELILHSAARLIRVNGYHRVGIDEIGAAAGISGPSVYGHFSSKVDVLIALLDRVADLLDAAVRTASQVTGPAEYRLAEISWAHVYTALNARDFVSVYATELHNVPAAHARTLQQRRNNRIRICAECLTEVRPQITMRLARVTSQAATEMIFGIARSRRFDDIPALATATHALTMSALVCENVESESVSSCRPLGGRPPLTALARK